MKLSTKGHGIIRISFYKRYLLNWFALGSYDDRFCSRALLYLFKFFRDVIQSPRLQR